MKKTAALLAFITILSTYNITAFAAFPANTSVTLSSQKITSAPNPKKKDKATKKDVTTKTPEIVITEVATKDEEKPTVTGDEFKTKLELAVLKKQNEERASLGLGNLEYDAKLCSAARFRSRELCETDTFAHERPDGRAWNTVLIEEIPVKYATTGENLCMTEYPANSNFTHATDPQFWFEQWLNSPTHYEIMIKPEFTHAGVGIYYVERKGTVYVYATTIFANY